MNNENDIKAFVNDDTVYNKKIKSIPKPPLEIGVDTNRAFFQNIANAGINNQIDISAFNNFSNVAQDRNTTYNIIDSMCEDSIISAVLETYAEDATEYNDQGQIVWVESSDANCQKFISGILDTMRVDKNIYNWVYSLCKYGDLYLKLCRESDYKIDSLFDSDVNSKQKLNEDVKIKAYSNSDHFSGYLDKVPNPAEIFELTKFNKTYAYIKTHINAPSLTTNNNILGNQSYTYRFKKSDIDIHSAVDYVHAALEDNSNRNPEEVKIFLDDKSFNEDDSDLFYTVRKGQSIFYNTFKIWRELSLLENSILLNRITKSAILRLINIEVGDMPKEMIGPHLDSIKNLIEQKTAFDTDKSINEYTNPGPIENTIYIPTHEGKGAITADQVGGDVTVGQLSDLDYFKNKFYGSMRIPKQYFGDTEDGAGFNGGQSLSIISSRYAKAIKRIQNAIIQALTDAINIILLDRDMDRYVNKFTIKMLPPTTQEEIDRRDNLASKMGIVNDVVNLTAEIDNPTIKLKILKTLLSSVITDGEIIELIQEQIDNIDNQESNNDLDSSNDVFDDFSSSADTDVFSDTSALSSDLGSDNLESDFASTDNTENIDTALDNQENTADTLPTPEDIGIDMTDNTANLDTEQ